MSAPPDPPGDPSRPPGDEPPSEAWAQPQQSRDAPPGWYTTNEGQRYWDGHAWSQHIAPPNPQVIVNTDNSNNSSLAPVTSLVCGLIALLGCSWVPFIQLGALVFGPLAIIFGILGVQRGRAEHKLMSWIGIATGALATIVAVVFLVLIGSALNDVDNELNSTTGSSVR